MHAPIYKINKEIYSYGDTAGQSSQSFLLSDTMLDITDHE